MGLAATSELLELKILALVADPQIFSSRIVLVSSFRKPRKGFLPAVRTLSAPDIDNKFRTFRHDLP